MFTRKSVFTFNKTEEIEEDIEPQEDADDKKIIRIFAEFAAFGALSKTLEEMSIEVTKEEHL